MMADGSPSILPELVSGRGTARRSRVVEGESRLRFRENPRNCRVRIIENNSSGNPQSPNAGPSEPSVPRLIAGRIIAHVMRDAVHFDRKPSIATVKVENVRTAGMLPAEFEPAGAFAKFAPKQSLRQRQFSSQLSCAIDASGLGSGRNVFEHCSSPSVSLRELPPRDKLGEGFASPMQGRNGS